MAPDRTTTRLAYSGSALSLAGLAVAAYLTVAHYTTAKVLSCPANGIVNCVKVTTSSYAVQHGVPLAVAGLAFFAVMVGLQLPAAWRSPRPVVRVGRLAWAGIGTLSVLWLIDVELFSLDAICLYCTAIHALTILLFALTSLGTAATAPDLASMAEHDSADGDQDGTPTTRAAERGRRIAPSVAAAAPDGPRTTPR